jgi:Protein of unknown function (DUF4229)
VVALMKYSVLRLALFVAILGLLGVLGAGPMIAIIGAALSSMMLSYIFLRGPRDEVTAEIAERVKQRSARRGPTATQLDEAIEDAAADAADADGRAPGGS